MWTQWKDTFNQGKVQPAKLHFAHHHRHVTITLIKFAR